MLAPKRLHPRSIIGWPRLQAPPAVLSQALALGCRAYAVATKEKTAYIDLPNAKVNQTRLMQSLHETCAFGAGERWGSAPTETGMSRLALSDTDKQARDWFVKTVETLGCRVTVDAMGNIFAVRPGRNGYNAPATFAGSHLDTQPRGGRYDGILGIHAGVEILRVLQEHDIDTEFPVGVVNWTNEEGARFPLSMVSSGVWSGSIPLENAHNLREVGGGTATMKSELERIGYLGAIPASFEAVPMAAHFELHIEQGPVLEAHQQKIGIVTGVQAYRWYTLDVQGRDSHTGTTPFVSRADAMLLAARMIVHSQHVAASMGALASTGILTTVPSSTNTVPGHVRFSLDVRSPKDAVVSEVEAVLRRDFDALARGELEPAPGSAYGVIPKGLPLVVKWETDFISPATRFHPHCIAAVREAALSVLDNRAIGESSGKAAADLVREMTSGAGHDTVFASRRCPASMIFVPCRDGVSHNPAEYTDPEDCALGAEVLLHSVLRYDRQRALQKMT